MTTREILTIQLGHYSNFIGTHWWNLQETNFSYDPDNPSEINHDVLYREGETAKKEVTFTPRLLLVDLKGTLGYLNERGTLYDRSEESGAPLSWESNDVEVAAEPAVPKTPFIRNLERSADTDEPSSFNLEDEVTVWSDYLVPRFHPRTVNIVKDYKHECSSQPFDVFNYGQNLWRTEQFSDDFADRIRAYVEECDLMQGFQIPRGKSSVVFNKPIPHLVDYGERNISSGQILLDATDGFSGLGASCMQHLCDEYGKSILAFPAVDAKTAEPSAAELIKVVNTVLCWQHVGEHASLFSPLCAGAGDGDPLRFDNVTYNTELKYHSSAILATALDTLTLRYRHKRYAMSALSDLCSDLNKLGRKAAATSLCLPFPMTARRDLVDVLDDFDGPLWTSLTPNCTIATDRSMQSLALRGIPEERLKRPMQEAKKQVAKPAYRCSTVHEMMSMYLAYSCYATATYLTTVESGLTVKDPYPRIFNNNVHENGDIAAWPVGEEVKSVPVMAGLHSGAGMSQMFESLHNRAKRVKNINRLHAFTDSGLEQDEFTECLHHLLDCKEAYEEDHYV